MPHCCPQKQQCVFTSRSGSTLVDSRTPVIAERCGPKRSMMRRGSAGISATDRYLHVQFFTWRGIRGLSPQGALRQTEECAPALGTDVLVVAATRQIVAKVELLLDDGQVAHHRPRGKGLATSTARRLLP